MRSRWDWDEIEWYWVRLADIELRLSWDRGGIEVRWKWYWVRLGEIEERLDEIRWDCMRLGEIGWHWYEIVVRLGEVEVRLGEIMQMILGWDWVIMIWGWREIEWDRETGWDWVGSSDIGWDWVEIRWDWRLRWDWVRSGEVEVGSGEIEVKSMRLGDIEVILRWDRMRLG